jgi:hypothetical protein
VADMRYTAEVDDQYFLETRDGYSCGSPTTLPRAKRFSITAGYRACD